MVLYVRVAHNFWCVKAMILILKGIAVRIITTIRGFMRKQKLRDLEDQDLSRFCDHDIILRNEADVKRLLPDILGQALARAWVDKRFLDAFIHHPIEILERGGVYLPSSFSIVFEKEDQSRPKVTIYTVTEKNMKKVLELKLILVAEQ